MKKLIILCGALCLMGGAANADSFSLSIGEPAPAYVEAPAYVAPAPAYPVYPSYAVEGARYHGWHHHGHAFHGRHR